MEFYFSDANLQKDRFLKKEIEATKDGCKTFKYYFSKLYIILNLYIRIDS